MKINDFFKRQLNNINEGANVYVCGPTVYDHAHIGNVRPLITFDVLNRNFKLNYVHNITDIDDKIIAKAEKLSISEKEVSEKYEAAYLELISDLNILKPDHMPRVTDNIEGMIEFIQELIEKGFAYESNGSVYFSVNKLNSYGIYANLSLDTLITADESNNDKNDSKDFAIWKSTDKGVQFSSPWGEGRPGWHTECSYFILKYFEENGIDLHGGGIDLKFPHHVNEVAQYEAYVGAPVDTTWLYVGHITTDDEKMSKSEGNVIYAKDFIAEYGYDVLKHLILSTKYSKPLNLNNDTITNSINSMNKIKNSLVKTLFENPDLTIEPKITIESKEIISNDLDTPSLFTKIFEDVKKLNKIDDKEEKREAMNIILGDLSILGIEYKFAVNSEEINSAKANKDFDKIDNIKEEMISC